MKCDHIRTRMQGDTPFFPNMLNNANVEVCLKSEVDAAIDELKTEHHKERDEYIEMVAQLRRENAELKMQVNGFKNRSNLWEYNAQNEHNAAVAVRMENAKLKAKLDKTIAERDGNQVCIDALKQKLQDQCISCPVKMQEDDVVADKDKEIRRLKRALYKVCAEWAHHRVFVRFNTNEKAWENMEHKCLQKAKEYK